MNFDEQRKLEDTYVMNTFARKPVEFVHGRGMEVKDDAGNTYLDFLAGIGVVSLGHCHPALVDALEDQAHELIHVSNYYYIEHRGEVAHAVSNMLNTCVQQADRAPWQSFFANSGAEANECAFKLARLYAKKRAQKQGNENVPNLIVSLEGSFHGRTLATLAATAQPAKQEAFQPLPGGFVSTPLNDVDALEELFAAQGDNICAVVVECVQGESGVHPCTAEFLQTVRRLTEEHAALLICDEIQCGMYRCGTYPFGFQHFGITPDVVTIAKGIASGFPMGMCAARSDVACAFEPGDHGTTFGGSCLAVAAAQATLLTLAEEDVATNVEQVGKYLRARLTELPGVVEVRGLGLMVASDLAEGVSAPDVVSRGLKAGLILNSTGPRTLRFLPPLICTTEHVDTLIERLSEVLEAK